MAIALITLALLPLIHLFSNRAAHIQEEWMKVKDSRMSVLAEALEGMKLIKLQAWEKPFSASRASAATSCRCCASGCRVIASQ